MVAAYPDYYRDPHVVKTRLQVTSNPFFKRDDAGKVAAGMIDFNLAMHDPEKDWLKKKGEAKYDLITKFKWLRDKIELIDPDGNTISISTKKIYRIMVRDDIWYVYTTTDQTTVQQGQIKKYGPAEPKQANLGLKIFECSTQEASGQYALNEIEDLVLYTPFAIRN
jgi:hypothetical protein